MKDYYCVVVLLFSNVAVQFQELLFGQIDKVNHNTRVVHKIHIRMVLIDFYNLVDASIKDFS